MRTKLIVAALAATFACGSALAMTESEYKAQKDKLSADYKVMKDRCKGMSGNAKDICQAEVKGEHEIAEKELTANYKPTDKNQYDARVAKADAVYNVAKEKCDDLKGNDKDVCVKEAKATYAKAKANAKVAKAEGSAAQKTASASAAISNGNSKETEKVIDAKRNANDDMRDADYKVAKEKCDAMSGQAKDNCVAAAKLKYGK
jgi:hypothetical protein